MQQLHKPPKDEEASELFLKLLETPPSDVVDFPRKGEDGKPIAQIRIQVLPMEQHDRARIEAFKHFKAAGYDSDDLKHLSMREVLGDRIAKELIASACLTAKSQLDSAVDGSPIYGRIFHSADQVDKLRADEVTVLFNHYKLVQAKYGPFEYGTDVEAWVKRLAEGGEHYPLLSLDLPELVTLTSSLVARVSGMSRALESMWEELPDTCKSRLEKFSLGTGYWSSRPENSDQISMDQSDDLDLDTNDAIELSRKMRGSQALRDALDIDE